MTTAVVPTTAATLRPRHYTLHRMPGGWSGPAARRRGRFGTRQVFAAQGARVRLPPTPQYDSVYSFGDSAGFPEPRRRTGTTHRVSRCQGGPSANADTASQQRLLQYLAAVTQDAPDRARAHECGLDDSVYAGALPPCLGDPGRRYHPWFAGGVACCLGGADGVFEAGGIGGAGGERWGVAPVAGV